MATELEVVEGLQFDRGYISPYFITNAEKMFAEFEDPYLLIHEKKLSSLQPLLPLLEQVVQSGRPLVIIAEDVEGRGARHLGGEPASAAGSESLPSRRLVLAIAARRCSRTSPS